MNTPEQKPDMFYLGINKDTGELEEVVPPSEKTILLKPSDYKLYNLKDLGSMKDLDSMEEKQIEAIEQLEFYEQRIKEYPLQKKDLRFYNVPGKSVCGGSCGGIPFSWC